MLREIVSGYRESGAGLLVPEDTPREREVWTRDEQKLLDRLAVKLKGRDIRLLLQCNDPRCADSQLEFVPVRASREFILRCKHKDRVFTRAI